MDSPGGLPAAGPAEEHPGRHGAARTSAEFTSTAAEMPDNTAPGPVPVAARAGVYVVRP
ncbi:hypothetical protein [Streptomyces sp. bgisy091]|uniref:hypothetical protein n=1 Tax=Streptomyces sp. bgisy091 TaxID=3413778 RepID=UPI003D747772